MAAPPVLSVFRPGGTPRAPRASGAPRVSGASPLGRPGGRAAPRLRWLLAAAAALGLLGGAPRAAAAADETGFRVAAEVLALRDVRVPAEVSGRVVARPEDETAVVKEGEVVVALDDALLKALARGARAAAERAKARLEWAEAELKRERDLRAKDTVGQANLDQAELARREAAASLEAAEAAAEEAATRLARTKIRAPFAGRLVRIPPERGEYLRVGETAFRIVDLSALRVIAYVPAARVGAIRPGQTVRVRAQFEDARVAPLPATVFSVASAAEGRARTFRVEVRLRNGDGRLRPGTLAEVAFGG